MQTYNKKWNLFIKEGEFDPSKFVIQKTLNKKIWKNAKIDEKVQKTLMNIANEFYEHLSAEVEDIPELEDVIFTGSVASYNYHDLSDIDLHLILDFTKFDKNPELLEKYFIAKRINWNKVHNIMVNGHEVEIYIQDSNEDHMASGIYSLQDDAWIKKPKREEVSIDFETAKKKYDSLSKEILELQDMFLDGKYREVHNHTIKLKDKIKKMRRSGLRDEGIYSNENLAFKMLRINLDLEKLGSLKTDSYDKMMSVSNSQKIKIKVQEIWKNYLTSG
jgi:predicted nucleotidyltransferase